MREGLGKSMIAAPEPHEDIVAVHEALDDLAKSDPVAARLTCLRFFGGLTMEESAEVLGMSVRSAQDVWAYARSWLRRRVRPE